MTTIVMVAVALVIRIMTMAWEMSHRHILAIIITAKTFHRHTPAITLLTDKFPPHLIAIMMIEEKIKILFENCCAAVSSILRGFLPCRPSSRQASQRLAGLYCCALCSRGCEQ
ncbi:MAG: hypothetical protein J5861_05350 [Desulfovibrio sp.]|nr:hypothetical protein [Desulfovibrio sp.]